VTRKEAETDGIRLFYEQVELTTNQVDSFIGGEVSRHALDYGVEYLKHAYNQYTVHAYILDLEESRHYKDVEWFWSKYWGIVSSKELTVQDLRKLENFEKELKATLNEVSAEENELKKNMVYWLN